MDAVNKEADPATGGWKAQEESVTRTVAQLARSDRNVKEFVIGIASNGDQGMADRFNAKYKEMGYDEIRPVYETSSDSFRKQMEATLVDKFGDNTKCANEIGGGGGPEGSGTQTVYFAAKHYDEPPVHEGPRGGTYYYNSSGNQVYGAPSEGVYEGPRGGHFVYTESGNKRYL